MFEKKQELVKSKGNSPAEMIRTAVEGKMNLDNLEKFLVIQKDWEANEARKLFALSFAAVQEKIAVVVKTKLNPQTRSKYADLGDIIESAKPVYTKEGFSVIFYEGETSVPEHIRICADVLHRAGHKETYHYDVPPDGVGLKGNPNMTKIHAKASSTSYGRRYLMCMIWNIPTQDNDGQSATGLVEYITEKQVKQIQDLAVELKIDNKLFLSYMGLESLERMPKGDFKKAMTAIELKREKNADN